MQGRVSGLLVKYHTKHLKEIADKYTKAYEPYMSVLDLLTPESKQAAEEK